MSEKLDLDELERANLGKVVQPEDWMAVLAYARELERRVELRSMLLREQTDRLGAANLRIIELESASQPGGGEAKAVLCISAKELADVLELAAPDAFPVDFDRDHEQMDTEMCIGRLTGSLDDDGADTGPGLFAWYTEYPEEGVIPLRLDRDVRASIDALRAAPSAGNGGAEGSK